MRLTKVHLILLISLALLVGGGMVYLLSPKQFPRANDAYVEEPVITPTGFIALKPGTSDTASWKTFTDDSLKLSIKYPPEVIIDKRQTVTDRVTVFIFATDKDAQLPGKVTALYVADTHKENIDGFSAFRQGDCGTRCDISYKKTPWITINNGYGIQNPLPGDIHNYYITDKDQSGSVVNIYVGGYVDTKTKGVKEKIATFEEMIKTINFDR